jgi:hypothetical protein
MLSYARILLRYSHRTQGLSIGTWHITQAPPTDRGKRPDALVYIDNLHAREPPEAGRQEAKYHFQMTLSLRSRPLGRWNKLDFVRYAVCNIIHNGASYTHVESSLLLWAPVRRRLSRLSMKGMVLINNPDIQQLTKMKAVLVQ